MIFMKKERILRKNKWIFLKDSKFATGPLPSEVGLYKVLISGNGYFKERYAYYYPATLTWGLDRNIADKIIAWKY